MFHIKNEYVILSSDAEKVSELLHCPTKSDMVKLKDTDVETIARLGEAGVQIQIISYLNNQGEHDYPDIEQIKQDKLHDY